MSYKLTKNIITGATDEVILRIADNAFIPCDEGNKDYQDYLTWVAEGNTAEAAD
tara:strand:- start:291 stop:452 length:162 start_codon:yes stop_codon:yes gene_type:complete